jgi:hypothetical protein
MSYGKIGDLAKRVVVWMYDWENLGSIEKEIRVFVPDFELLDYSMSEAVYTFSGSKKNHLWLPGQIIIYDMQNKKLYRRSRKEVMTLFKEACAIL